MSSSVFVSSPKKLGTKHNPAKWDDERTRILLEVMESEIIKGNRPNGVFSKTGWRNIVSRFNACTSLTLNKDQLKNKQDNLRREYTKWESLIGKETGLGWDNNKRTIDAPNEWWIEKAKDDPTILRYRDEGPVHLELLQRIFRGVIANGLHAYIPEMPDDILVDNEQLDNFEENVDVPEVDYAVVNDTNASQENTFEIAAGSASKLAPQKRKRQSTSGKQSQCDRVLGAVESISCSMRENLEAIQARRRADDSGMSYIEALELLKGIPGMSYENPVYWKGVRVLEDKIRRIAFGHVLHNGKPSVVAWLSTFPDY